MDKEYLIKKWLDNDLSETEAKAFEALEQANLYKEIIEEAQGFSGTLHAKVKPFETLEKQLEDKTSDNINWLQTALKIAAIFVVGFAVFTLLNRDKIQTFETNLAQNETITLPDYSIVKLNEKSQLDYNASKWEEKRALNLKGEAFFDVEKGSRFDVSTAFGTVSVLGTEFNVISRDSIFGVSCYEGLVQVTYGNETVKLPAGTKFILESGIAKKTTISVAEPFWIKKMSTFKNASIAAVLKEIEYQFNVTILKEFNNKDLMFTGAFEHTNLDNALKSVTQPLNLTYEIRTNNVVVIKHGED
jgi:ferric-dicitrate binding protein FerR (iron transport regulator)